MGLLLFLTITLGFAAVPALIAFLAVKATESERVIGSAPLDNPAMQQPVRPLAVNGDDGYIPNQIPLKTRIWNVCLSAGLLVYGAVGLYANDLFIPGKRSKGVHLHDYAAWIMFAAMVCAVLNLLSVVADHYDHRNNERYYRHFATSTQLAGWGFFIGAFIVAFVYKQGT